jgi:hypothetical protein
MHPMKRVCGRGIPTYHPTYLDIIMIKSLFLAAAVISLASCSSTKKEECTSCCTAPAAKGAQCVTPKK